MMSQKVSTCKGCGCSCRFCNDHSGLHLHAEIENLKQRLIERENHIVEMETNFLKESEKFPNGEMAAISEELLTWQDKYSRLYEAHKRVQKVNQNLEDKLLRIVDKCETEKNALTTEVANLTRRLVDEKFNVSKLQEENERYRNDVNLAIQLLQCKPSNFVAQKYDSLPSDMQAKVRMYLSSKRRQSDGNGNVPKPEIKTIKVPIPTFPPTAMVYSVNKTPAEKENTDEKNHKDAPVDIVSAAIMAKVLEERERERAQMKHCETCSCGRGGNRTSRSTQTDPVPQPTPTINNRKWDERRNVTEGILVNLEPTTGEDSTSESSSGDLISFGTGPRACSVRLQPGSSNILLDNAVGPLSPILYRGRTEASVHTVRSRSTSSSSSSIEEIARRNLRTETEI